MLFIGDIKIHMKLDDITSWSALYGQSSASKMPALLYLFWMVCVLL